MLQEQEMEALNERCEQLSKKHGRKVHAYVSINESTGDRVVGFYKEPNYAQKLYAMDKIASVGPFTAGEELRQALTLTGEDESNPLIYSEDKYKLAIAGICISLIEVATNDFKKK